MSEGGEREEQAGPVGHSEELGFSEYGESHGRF